MKTATETFNLPCGIDTFWSLFFDETYLRGLYLEAFKFRDFSVLEMRETSRKLRIVPKVNMPAVLEKVVGDFAYEEHATLDRARNEWTWRMVPKKELVATRGTIRAEPTSDKTVRRTDNVTIEGKIFGLGGIIESSVVKELQSSWAKESAFLNAWLAK